MDHFVKSLFRLTVIILVILAVVLFAAAAILIFAPKVLLYTLYYALIAGCIIFGMWIIVSLIRAVFDRRGAGSKIDKIGL